jgi:hypothetical protein
MKTSLPLFILGMSALSACASVPTPEPVRRSRAPSDRHRYSKSREHRGADGDSGDSPGAVSTLPAEARAKLR